MRGGDGIVTRMADWSFILVVVVLCGMLCDIKPIYISVTEYQELQGNPQSITNLNFQGCGDHYEMEFSSCVSSALECSYHLNCVILQTRL